MAQLQPDDDLPIRDYRLRVTIRNNRLLTHIERSGAKSLREFCDRHKLSYLSLQGLVRMERAAWSIKYGGWVPSVVRLSNILGVAPEQLFTGRQVLAAFEKRSVERQIDEGELQSLSAPQTLLLPSHEADPETMMIGQEISGKLLDILTERQRFVVEHWLGLNSQPAMTLDEIAGLLPHDTPAPISRERIRQIYGTAVRRMRRRAVQLRVLDSDRVTIEGYILTPQQAAERRERYARDAASAREHEALKALYGTTAMREEFRNMRNGPRPPPPPPPLPLPQWRCARCNYQNRSPLPDMPVHVFCMACGHEHRNSSYADPKPPPRTWLDLPLEWGCVDCRKHNYADLRKLPHLIYCGWCGHRHSNSRAAN